MKRVISVVLMALLALVVIKPVVAKADVIWEPYDSKFYEKNQGNMKYENRGYCVNSPEGYAYTYESPDKSKKAIGYRTNGDTVFCTWSIEYDGHKWGLITYKDYEWIILDDCYKTYDGSSFCTEYAEQIVTLEEVQPVELKKEYFSWKYPGSASSSKLFDCADAYPDTKFVDEEGNEWYHFNYVYGDKNFWVNMTDPTNKDCKIREVKADVDVIYPAVTPENVSTKSETTENNNVEDNWDPTDSTDSVPFTETTESKTTVFAVGGILLAAVLAAAAAIIVKIRKN